MILNTAIIKSPFNWAYVAIVTALVVILSYQFKTALATKKES